uniref:Uncharacterized protein n=1 Tax=Nelumbo nucifera TaxID=4432 RepID=A0A822YZB8_NELNU|nr:TPA_asm: hypothetical protein HUJ06_005208 [Nelumbo nucifera]
MSLSQSQPAVVYPTTVSPHPPSHSRGSFGTVFIVLAVIIVISTIACFLGRLCNSHFSSKKPRRDRKFHPKERDLECGFNKGMPTAKPTRHGDQGGNGEFKEFKPADSFETKGETKPAENGDAKATA